MGGNFNHLGNDVQTSGFTLDRAYDHVDVLYDGLDRVVSAIYYQDAGGLNVLDSFSITYSPDGWPIENGTEYKNNHFDIYRGRFVSEAASGGENDKCCGFSTTISGNCNQSFSFSRYELISNTSNEVVTWPLAAEQISVVSTSSDDTSGGGGIRTLMITGIDSVGAEINETIIMNGLVPVVSTLFFKRVNFIRSLTSGSNEVASGKISFINTSLQLIDTISYGFSRAASLKYTVPTSRKLTIKSLRLSADRLGEYEIKLLIYERNPTTPQYAFVHTIVNSHSDTHITPGELELQEETDIACVVKKKSGKNGFCSSLNVSLFCTQTLIV